MLKATLLGVLTTAMLSTVSIGAGTIFPVNPVKEQDKIVNDTVNYTESAYPYIAANEDPVCDYCLAHDGEHSHRHHFIDANGDGICDNYPVTPEYQPSSNAEYPSEYTTETYSHHNRGCRNSHRRGCHR